MPCGCKTKEVWVYAGLTKVENVDVDRDGYPRDWSRYWRAAVVNGTGFAYPGRAAGWSRTPSTSTPTIRNSWRAPRRRTAPGEIASQGRRIGRLRPTAETALPVPISPASDHVFLPVWYEFSV
jgi:hypothetical protein